jgi:hypothetical protein
MKKLSNEELIKILQNTAVRIGMGGYVQELINKADKLEAELLRRPEMATGLAGFTDRYAG